MHGNFPVADDETIVLLLSNYTSECDRSRRAIANDSLDALARADGMDFTLRFALTHMIGETARHCGHLDLLREHIDGVSGQ